MTPEPPDQSTDADRREAAREALARLMGSARRITVFTGAGLSTECGVPDFRSPDSPWRVNRPIDFRSFLADPAVRAEAWRRKFAMDDLYAHAAPGRGHLALARMALEGRLVAIITQNIDGLQQAAGLSAEHLIELHGNGTFARCLSCGLRHELEPIRRCFEATGSPPFCGCGGIVKSASIAFGQPLGTDELRRSTEAALSCDLMLILGSTLLVRPAAQFPVLAKRNGASLAIVNHDPTPLDDAADLVIRDDIGAILSSL